jgi:arylsulfatase A-like enzyme
MVSVDCMRRDRVSAYGYARKTTPFLDAFLERAMHCTSAHSASPWTCPSVITLLTGLYPHHHGGGLVPGEPKNLSKHNLPTRLADGVATLPGLLAARGYATAAVGAVWNAHLSIPDLFGKMAMMEKPARTLVRRALKWIRAQDGPYCLWLHLGDAHEPLDVPRSMRNEFGPVGRIKNVRQWDYTKASDPVPSDAFDRYREARIRLYDVAVRSADGAIGELWEGLRRAGHADRTVFVVTSDHGEEFWEHRQDELEGFTDPRDVYGTGHGHNLFQVHLLVPLVVAGPGIAPGELRSNVTLADVTPTVLQALGIESPPMDGRSLVEPDRSAGDRSILAEGIAYGYEKRSVVRGDLKLLVGEGDRYERVFRLGDDRRETGVVSDPGAVAELRSHLPAGEGVQGEQVEATKEIVDHLRELGYID